MVMPPNGGAATTAADCASFSEKKSLGSALNEREVFLEVPFSPFVSGPYYSQGERL